VWQELLYTANVGLFDGTDYQEAVAKLRRFSVEASALDIAWPRYIRSALALSGIDLRAASRALLGLSNTIATSDSMKLEFREQVQLALRLPRGLGPSST
jgi:hypothetical protein